MTLTVNTDSYITVEEADSYFAETLKSADWELVGENKEIVLKMACKKIELLSFVGNKAVAEQPLLFPRDFGTPAEIKNGQAELALWLFKNQNNKLAQFKQMGIKSLSMGNESYSFADNTPNGSIQCPEAWEFLGKYLRKGYPLC